MAELHSDADNVENLAQCIVEAFRTMNVQEGQVLLYDDLYPYLQEKYPKYKDVQTEAEHHLAKEAIINPAPDGLMLTQVGSKAIYGG
ncbi:hypothetical protein ACFSKU_13540 [Pontibacter silvestris]|uniref:Uncharacterized protein n=1 Tax=Pontibacter silvestris TaxID=2305183 RepID=A0ABW4WZ97_9BACT|nr:hypothetical protein [Pontibacter silvestris]MCC9135528.1 hypothetical protein [Pontibacter silvestris]